MRYYESNYIDINKKDKTIKIVGHFDSFLCGCVTTVKDMCLLKGSNFVEVVMNEGQGVLTFKDKEFFLLMVEIIDISFKREERHG